MGQKTLRKAVILLLFCAGLQLSSKGQDKCGTQITPETVQEQSRFMPGYFGCTYINNFQRTLQITVHIAEDSLGNTNFSEINLDDALDFLNYYFEPIGLNFQICAIRYMEDFQFDIFDRVEDQDDMVSMYYQQNTINLYLTQTVEVPELGDVNGYATFPGGQDIIVVKKSAINGSSTTLPHEMGHFFGLYHTFETDLGEELVDGSNCETAGDLVCDTEADPDEEGNASPAPDCNYTGEPATDMNGDYYVPPTNNLMSYYSQQCRCRFTPQQYNRMLEQYLQLRNYLW